MVTSGLFRHVIPIVIIAAAFAPAASAQVILDAPSLLPRKPTSQPPPAPANLSVWPRLDAGAVVCRTQDDLDRHAANMVARVSGGATQVADCRIIPQPVAIQILTREGPGRTQVKLTGSDGMTGWTDAWLPDKVPTRR